MWAGEKQLFSHNMGTQCAWLRRGMKYRRKKGLQGAFMSPSRFTQEGYSKCAWKTEAPEPSGAKQMHEEGYTAHIRCGRKVCWHFNGECEGGLGCIWPPWDLCPAHDADQRGAGRCQGCKTEAESIWNPCRGGLPRFGLFKCFPGLQKSWQRICTSLGVPTEILQGWLKTSCFSPHADCNSPLCNPEATARLVCGLQRHFIPLTAFTLVSYLPLKNGNLTQTVVSENGLKMTVCKNISRCECLPVNTYPSLAWPPVSRWQRAAAALMHIYAGAVSIPHRHSQVNGNMQLCLQLTRFKHRLMTACFHFNQRTNRPFIITGIFFTPI